jgi:thioredoxin reductase
MADSPLTPEPDTRHTVTILVNDHSVTFQKDHATGHQIKAAAGLPEDLQLYGSGGELIANDELVELHENERFTTAPKAVEILVNNRAVEVPGHEVTGAQIKNAAEVPADFKLYGPNGTEVTDGQTIKVKHDERFTAISGQDVS